ncbi:hypothetical protein CFB39_25375 [Burkholderia sp. AU6039]|nr:hypothetical protein CFB39_25375 [Burkholderia sp. AU6039]
METHLHTGASASIHNHPLSSHGCEWRATPDMSCTGSMACLPLLGKSLDATAPAFAIAIRPA